jgi:tRNA (guanine37-N1)-methyltransferase
MRRFGVVTIFPEMLDPLVDFGVSGRALREGVARLETWNPRDFTEDRHRTVDERPYGGGPGMVMSAPPLCAAIRAARAALGEDTRVVYLSPQGRGLTQARAAEFADSAAPLLLVAGRYEGIDERVIALEVDEELSIGDYVLSGGELAAMVVLDAVIRLLPGALGHGESAVQDSFSEGLLDCPHYTRPEVFEGLQVPEVLLSGDHERIRRWRREQAEERTRQRRPDLDVVSKASSSR